MACDSVTNLVVRLQECGFDPRRVGDDSWEARCPAHGSADYALAVTRGVLDQVQLECRGTARCPDERIVGSLGFTDDDVFAETPDWLISRVRGTPIHSASFQSESGSANGSHEAEMNAAEGETNAAFGETSVAAEPKVTLEQADHVWVENTLFDLSSDENGQVGHADASRDEVLARVTAEARLFRSNDGRLFAQVPVGERHEIFGVKSAAFRDWLIHEYLKYRVEPPSQMAVRRAVGMVEARARFEQDVPEVFVRVGKSEDGHGLAYFVDLGDSSGRAIAIRASGWVTVDQPSLHFRRPEGLLPLPTPSRDGSLERLRSYVNLTDADFRLMVAWLTAVLRPVGPYPILVLTGEQGAAKSTLVKIIRLLIDPHACTALSPPASTRDLMTTAVNGWLLAYDNISEIPRWLSDALCQLVFGGAISGRALFTNDVRSFIHAQRPVLLSGIGDFVRWADLKDRCVFLQLPPIPRTRRRGEDEFWRAFQADRPAILGALLDAIAGGLREWPSVHLTELPRMADYATWGEAVGRGLGWGPESFLSAYVDNRKEATLTDLLASPLGKVLLQVTRHKPIFSSPPATLHSKLAQLAGKTVAASADWPKTAEKFGAELRRLAPQLRLHGISVSFERGNKGRIITVRPE